MARAGADAILLPKVEGADTVRRALHVLDLAGAPAELAIWCMIETPRGILHVEEIADTERVYAWSWAPPTSPRISRRTTRPAGCRCWSRWGPACWPPAPRGSRSSTACTSISPTKRALPKSCLQGRDLGFEGRTLIHPRQIAPANAAFGPTATEVSWARRIIKAYDAARAAGKGVVVVDGKLVENLHVLEARRIVALAEMIEARAA